MTAHLFRANMILLPLICMLFPFLLFWKTKTSVILLQLSLFIFGLEWIKTMLFLINIRIASGENWIRMAVILSLVALLNFLSILTFRSKQLKKLYHLEYK